MKLWTVFGKKNISTKKTFAIKWLRIYLKNFYAIYMRRYAIYIYNKNFWPFVSSNIFKSISINARKKSVWKKHFINKMRESHSITNNCNTVFTRIFYFSALVCTFNKWNFVPSWEFTNKTMTNFSFFFIQWTCVKDPNFICKTIILRLFFWATNQ